MWGWARTRRRGVSWRICVGYLFSEMTWPQLQRAIEKNTVLLLPFAETEEHGRHLPVGCDTIIAERVALAVAEAVAPDIPALVLPSIPYGYSPRAATQWPGTFCIRWHVVVRYLADVCCSVVEMGFRRVVVISSHGPHGDVARLAAREVFDRTGVAIVVTQPHTMAVPTLKRIRRSKVGGMSHACEYETSLLMHFGYPVDTSGLDDRDSLKMCNEWVSGDLCQSGKVHWSTWAHAESETGTFGDPSCASPETGRACMEGIVEEYRRFLAFFVEHDLPPRRGGGGSSGPR